MNIVFVLTIDLSKPGPSVHLVNDIIPYLANKGHYITVLWQGDENSSVENDSLNINYIKIVNANVRKSDFIGRYIASMRYANKIKTVLKQLSFTVDSVFIQSNNTIFAFADSVRSILGKNVNIIYNAQDLFPDNLALTPSLRKFHIAVPFFRYLQKIGYKKVNSIITISEDMKEIISTYGIDKGKIKVAYNWCYNDEVPYVESGDVSILGDDTEGHFNIVYSGNVGVVQNVDFVIDVAKQMKAEPVYRFVIIGRGAYLEKIKTRCYEEEIDNVIFLNWLPENKASLVYSAADINFIPLLPGMIKTCLPSKTAICLASGKPVLTLFGNSITGNMINQYAGCYNSECNVEAVVNIIRRIHDEKVISQGYRCFNEYFRRIDSLDVYYRELVDFRR